MEPETVVTLLSAAIIGFLAQLLVCFKVKSAVVRGILELPLVAFLVGCGWYMFRAPGWMGLVFFVMLVIAAAAFAGNLLAWLVWWLVKRKKH